MITDRELAGLLLDERLIDSDRLDDAMLLQKRHGGDLYNVVIENGFVDEERTIAAVASKLNIPCVSLRDFEADPGILDLVPSELAARHRVVPVGLSDDGQSLYLAMANTIDVEAMAEVGNTAGHDVVALLAGPLDIERTIERVYEPTHRRPVGFGNLFLPPGGAPPSLADLESMDEDLESASGDMGSLDELAVRAESVEVEDVHDLYGSREEAMFTSAEDAFVDRAGLSMEGRKRLEEAAAVDELEIVRPRKGKTEAFRGWDDDEAIEPQKVDRSLFPPAAPQPPAPPRGQPRRLFRKRAPEARKPAPRVPVPQPAASASPQLPPRPSQARGEAMVEEALLKIGATIDALPRQKGMRRVSLHGAPSTGSTKARKNAETLAGSETRELVMALLRSLIKRGVITQQDVIDELEDPDKT